VTEGSISIPGELEKTMLQAIAGLLGGRVRVMVSLGLPVEINPMPDAGRSVNRHDRAAEGVPIIQICAPRDRGRQASLGAPNGGYRAHG
jgi:hypothetical protein